MSALAEVLEVIRYDRSVFGRFERRAIRDGWGRSNRELEIGHRTVKDTLVHILNVREAWLVAIPAKDWNVFEAKGRQPGEITSWASFRAYRERVDSAVDRFQRALTEACLKTRVRAPWMPGRYTVRDGILQASYEQAHHLGELIGTYWQSDRSPPSMTWIENR